MIGLPSETECIPQERASFPGSIARRPPLLPAAPWMFEKSNRTRSRRDEMSDPTRFTPR
jgi:hypothetical protein